ncbi:MAG: hypothetical protein KJO18_02080, partial [Acidimicrobiia bacterium]|nr:hypothetical protein [Acidimicrobiia bacterium]
MRDATEQLNDYFEATVERITVEDIVASRQVVYVPARAPAIRPHRPVWAVAVTFITTMVVLGGSLGVGLMLRRESTDVGGGTTLPATVPAGGEAPWIPWIGAGLLLVTVAGLVVARGRIEKLALNGGTAMTTTLQRPTPTDDRVDKLLKTNRTLTLTAIVLAVLAIGFGAWAFYQASGDDTAAADVTAPVTSAPIVTTAPPIATVPMIPTAVAAVIDDWWAALNLRDGSVLDLYELGGYTQFGTERFFDDDIASHLAGNASFDHEWLGEAVLIVDDGNGRYVVARGLRNFDANSSFTSAMIFEINTQSDGQLLLGHTAWV